jgi:hypothetical protein
MKKKQKTKVITFDDDEIQWKMLNYAGSREYWNEHLCELSNCDFVHDVLEFCSSVYIDSKSWDVDFPGRSGIEYTLTILDEESLKEELRERLVKLAEPAVVYTPTPKPVSHNNIEQIADYLRRKAAYIACLRDLPGHTGMSKMIASRLSEAARSLREEARDDEEVRSFLLKVAGECRSGGVADELRQIAASYRLPPKIE